MDEQNKGKRRVELLIKAKNKKKVENEKVVKDIPNSI